MTDQSNIRIAPSLLSADFCRMADAVAMCESAGADLLHCDVMDGEFVPNITFGPKMVADIRKTTRLPLDVHLMIIKPERFFMPFIDAGADIITFHAEAIAAQSSSREETACKITELLSFIKSKNIKAGVVLNPDTPVSALDKSHYPLCDMILLMSVFPGFGGQKFIPSVLDKISSLKSAALPHNPALDIEIDGGVTLENAHGITSRGCNVLVAGNTLFTSPDMPKAIKVLRGNK